QTLARHSCLCCAFNCLECRILISTETCQQVPQIVLSVVKDVIELVGVSHVLEIEPTSLQSGGANPCLCLSQRLLPHLSWCLRNYFLCGPERVPQSSEKWPRFAENSPTNAQSSPCELSPAIIKRSFLADASERCQALAD